MSAASQRCKAPGAGGKAKALCLMALLGKGWLQLPSVKMLRAQGAGITSLGQGLISLVLHRCWILSPGLCLQLIPTRPLPLTAAWPRHTHSLTNILETKLVGMELLFSHTAGPQCEKEMNG